jgi:aspartate/methionine/tyrosine aminotransferase
LVGQLFLNPEDTIFVSDKFWGNYNLIFEEAHQAKIKKFPLFNDKNQLAINETFQILHDSPESKITILLNFPNNPTGYTPTHQEADLIIQKLTDLAQSGKKIAAIMDDAYFGLNYLDEVYPESLFAKLAQAHENILAIKIDGVTKEDYAWGERIAFITYGSKNLTKAQMSALEDKTAGALRGNLSNCSTPSQSAILKTLKSPNYQTEKSRCYQILQARFLETKRVVELPKYQENFQALAFNSGYFMCIKIHQSVDVEKLRILLLDKYSTGVISTQGLIRVAFSSIPSDQIEQIFDNINTAIQELRA